MDNIKTIKNEEIRNFFEWLSSEQNCGTQYSIYPTLNIDAKKWHEMNIPGLTVIGKYDQENLVQKFVFQFEDREATVYIETYEPGFDITLEKI